MAKIIDVEKLAWVVVKRHFKHLLFFSKVDSTICDDINQIGHLCSYESNDDGKKFWNCVQRELYQLSKTLGFRRTRKNVWERKF